MLLTQDRYATDVLRHVGMETCKSLGTPLSSIEKLSVSEGDKLGPEDATRYRGVVGALNTLL